VGNVTRRIALAASSHISGTFFEEVLGFSDGYFSVDLR
jgi:hypothetical protein